MKLLFIVLLLNISVLAEIKTEQLIGYWTYDFKGTESFVEFRKNGTVIYGKKPKQQLKGKWSLRKNMIIMEITAPDNIKSSHKSEIISISKSKITLKDELENTLILSPVKEK